MKYFILLTCFFAFTNCQQESVKSEPNKEITTQKVNSAYLDFDEIVYYHHPTFRWHGWESNLTKEEDKILDKIAYDLNPKVKDMGYIKYFEQIGYEKTILKEEKFEAVKAIVTNKFNLKKYEKSQQQNKIESNIVGIDLHSNWNQIKYLKSLFLIINNQLQFSSTADENAVCEKIFRDILVFKKDEKNVGMAKICYECTDQRTVTIDNARLHIDEMTIAKVLDIQIR